MTGEKRFDGLDAKSGGLRNELEALKVNRFGHRKDFFAGILPDKGVINNQDKARRDNKLRGM